MAIISLVLIAGAGKLYSDRQDAMADKAMRRIELGKLITEYQHRLSALVDADSRLNSQLGPSGTFDQAIPLDRSAAGAVARWERLCAEVSEEEWDILTGSGDYVATSQEYRGVSITQIATQLENVAGIPDIQFGAMRMIGILEARPPATWLFVRSQIPMLTTFGVSRNMLYMNGTLPLLRGQTLTEAQERALGIPPAGPGDLERARRLSDRAEKILKRLEGNTEANQSAPAGH